jgi:hypothetical protein
MNKTAKRHPDFIVRNSVVILVIISIVFLAMLFSVFEYNTSLGVAGHIIVAVLAPCVGWFIRKKTKTVVIRINENGIYSYSKLITDWQHFKSATTDQLPLALGDPRDKVVLRIVYLNDNRDKLITDDIPLPNTLNKSEEQILSAIELFRRG